jgi:hypothetical protein
LGLCYEPFTLKFATPVNKASFTTKEAVEELKYDAKQQVNLASVNPSMAFSTCSQDSKSTPGGLLDKDWDTDRTKDD